ncbi:hypothetical protein KUV85_00580 [Nocardioides panacisoli]|uniref:hypothetical protein n=1 Tax=Nocardioides panacisoli TaxID=627624 RepID=UPI001C639AD6|nr:hypothetical protein [Nocardioides panacisoli]QYJ04209.1 hypothetical protein KUV85_00580 [Nocardioides panacisoli]
MESSVSSGAARWIRWGAVLTLLLGVAGAGAGYVYGRSADRMHEAEAVVLVHPSEGNPFSPGTGDDLVNLTTESELVTADAVAEAVARKETGVTADDVLASVSTVVPANTQLIRITVTHPDQQVATARAQAFADSYLDYRATRTTSALFDQGAHLAEQERTAEKSLAAAFDQLASLTPSTPARARVEQQIDVLSAQLAQLRTDQATVRSAAVEPGEVITPAAAAAAGPLPATVWATGAGALLGVAMAVGLTAARVRRRDVVDGRADLEAADHEVLGTPDDLTQVRARLLVAAPQRPLVCLAAGTSAGSPMTATQAAELAACFARSRWETIHVDLDPQAGTDPASVLPSRLLGLREVLRDEASIDDALAVQGPHLHRLHVGAGVVPEDLPDLVGGPTMGAIFDELRKRADFVLVSGPDLSDPGAHQLLAHVDCVLPWIVRRCSTLGELDAATTVASAAGVPVVGAVYDAGRSPARWGGR